VARVEVRTHAGDPAERILVVAFSQRRLATQLVTPGSACAIVVADLPAGFKQMMRTAESGEVHGASPTRDCARASDMRPASEAALALIVREVVRLLAARGRHLVTLFQLDPSEDEDHR
jgi:hypothetical protein